MGCCSVKALPVSMRRQTPVSVISSGGEAGVERSVFLEIFFYRALRSLRSVEMTRKEYSVFSRTGRANALPVWLLGERKRLFFPALRAILNQVLLTGGPFCRKGRARMKKLLDFARRFTLLYNENRLPMAAAALSYYLTMTFFPLVIVLYTMLGNNYVKAMRVLAFAEQFLAAETVTAIRDFLVYVATDRSSAMLIAGITVLLTSASAAVRAIHYTIGRMQGGVHYRGVWGLLFSLVCSLILVAGLYLVMIIMLAGRGLFDRLHEIIPAIDLGGTWNTIRFLLLAAIEYLLFWGIYLVSCKKGEAYDTFPGAILATLAMVAVSYVFSAFIGASVKYPMVYGSLASLILLMMWLYFCSLVIYCGAAFNIVLRDMKREKSLCLT